MSVMEKGKGSDFGAYSKVSAFPHLALTKKPKAGLMYTCMKNSKWAVLELPNVSIDHFKGDSLKNTCFFLSHAHKDHMEGLKKNSEFIQLLHDNPDTLFYCSSISREILLIMDLGFKENDIQVLDDKQLITIPERIDTKTTSYDVGVTIIPTGHCPGSVMFLFETLKETILYTGDFRICKGDVEKFRQLKNASDKKKIYKIYFDATFFNSDYWEFPTRVESTECAKSLIKEWLNQNSNNHVILRLSANYGYENLLIELSKGFKCKIHVEAETYKLFSKIPSIGIFLTQNEKKSRIHAIYRFKKFDFEHEHFYNIKEIILCAASFRLSQNSLKNDILRCRKSNTYDLCYSTHCSYSELIEFLNYLKPRYLVPLCETFCADRSKVKSDIRDLRSQWI